MPVPVFWSREDVKALIVVWKNEKIQEQIGKKRNTHVYRTIFLSIFLPQLTTNLELINTQIMRAGTQASDRDRDPDPYPDQNGVAV